MKYKNDNDNRYRVNFMRCTEKIMDQLTVKDFISYLEEKAEFEDFTFEYIDKQVVKCKCYDLTEENSTLHKEFLISEDGRVFYWRTVNDKIELVDVEEEKRGLIMTVEEIKTVLNEKCNNSWDMLKIMEHTYGQKSVRAEKALTRWVTYDDLFRELYNESPIYSFI